MKFWSLWLCVVMALELRHCSCDTGVWNTCRNSTSSRRCNSHDSAQSPDVWQMASTALVKNLARLLKARESHECTSGEISLRPTLATFGKYGLASTKNLVKPLNK